MAAFIPAGMTVISALIPLITKMMEGKEKPGTSGIPGIDKLSLQTPEQENLLQQIMQMLGGTSSGAFNMIRDYLSDDPQALDKFRAPLMRQFNEQTMPAIAERFAGSGALSSSGFEQAGSAAAAGLSENLAALREGMRSNALSAYGNLLNTGMSAQPFGFVNKEKAQSGADRFLGPLSEMFGKTGGSLLTQQLSGFMQPNAQSRNPMSTGDVQNLLTQAMQLFSQAKGG